MTISTAFSQVQLAPMFDRILSRIEAGEVQRAIAHLGGVFDAALIHCGEPALIRAVLHNHPLSEALRQPPLAAELALLEGEPAMAARAELARGWCASAAQRGHDWIDLDQSSVLPRDARFDLIVAADRADRLPTAALAADVATLAAHLKPQGRLVMSALLPGHLGWGWQTIWLNRSLQRHEPAALSVAAASAGLAARLFHDAGGTLVWAEMRQSHAATGVADA